MEDEGELLSLLLIIESEVGSIKLWMPSGFEESVLEGIQNQLDRQTDLLEAILAALKER